MSFVACSFFIRAPLERCRRRRRRRNQLSWVNRRRREGGGRGGGEKKAARGRNKAPSSSLSVSFRGSVVSFWAWVRTKRWKTEEQLTRTSSSHILARDDQLFDRWEEETSWPLLPPFFFIRQDSRHNFFCQTYVCVCASTSVAGGGPAWMEGREGGGKANISASSSLPQQGEASVFSFSVQVTQLLCSSN